MTSAKAPRGRRLSAEARQMLPWCVALSVAVHVLLLAVIVSSPRGLSVHAGGRLARTVSVRLIPPGSTPSLAAAAAVAMPSAAATAADAFPPAESVSSVTAAGPRPAAPTASQDSGAISGESDRGEGGYVPRPLLSVVPEPVIPVVIAAPPTAEGRRLIGRYRGVLALYIDEEGHVRRVEAESPALPEPMERAAREAFLAARFSAGQVAGRAVKSRIRVEVVFDDAPASSAASAASAASSSGAIASPGEGASARPDAQRSP